MSAKQFKPLESIYRKLLKAEENGNGIFVELFLNTPWLMTKYINTTTESPGKSGIKNYLQEKVLENYAFKVLCEGSYRFPGTTKRISKIAAATIDEFRKVDQSHRIFSTSRLVRFNEMEYNVPMSAYKDVIEEIRRW